MAFNKAIKLTLFISLLFPMPHALADVVDTNLRKSEEGRWSVAYQSAEPVLQLQFKRSPDHSRAQRWQLQEQFVIAYEDGHEIIRRRDGTLFSQVEAELSVTYIALDKEYAPFSPFSDGGMLLHSGRFFVCAEHCDNAQNEWPMRIEAPIKDSIIVQGHRHQGKAEWNDSNSGHNVYVGPAEQRHDGEFVSIVDEALPPSLRELMNSALPAFMSFYSRHLPAPATPPQLFASYSPTEDGRYGHQGGVLPNQVFMHWYGHVDELAADQTLWFFAHEAAHLFQQPHTFSSDASEAWLHEGSAELFAALAMDGQETNSPVRQSTVQEAKANCVHGLSEGMSFHQGLVKNSRLHYSCGLVLFDAMHRDLLKQDEDIFFLWNAYEKAVSQGKRASEATFIGVAAEYLSPRLSAQLRNLLQAENSNARDLINNL